MELQFTKVHVGGRTFLPPKELAILKAHENYTSIVLTSGKKLFVATTLGKIEKRLDNSKFLRVNRSTILNRAMIKSTSLENSIMWVELNNQETIRVSRRRKHYLLEALT